MNKEIIPTLNPFSVLVNWSESNEFNEGQLYDFMDFERKALDVAKQNPLGGYDKKQSCEHRNNYGIGQGSGLTNVDYLYHGWCIEKHVFWNESNKGKYVPLGEMGMLTSIT